MAEKQQKVDRTVVRNQPYKRGGIGIRERHNERKNEKYANPDIEPERFHLNVHFRKCETTYEKALDGMLERYTKIAFVLVVLVTLIITIVQ